MPRVALGIEYDGSGFCGWQIQNEGRSVQAAVQESLSRVADHPVHLAAAGRTDGGVHATAQVVHFDSTSQRRRRSWVLGANAHLPPDICVRWAQHVPDSFHARFSALSRSYTYLILTRPTRPALLRHRVCWTHHDLDAARMDEACEHLVGEHDFSSFRAAACQARTPMRNLQRLSVARLDEFICIEAEANAFLHHMVRNIAGLLLAIGRREAEPAWARDLLQLRDRTCGAVTAPSDGLYLTGVKYPGELGVPAPAGGLPVAL